MDDADFTRNYYQRKAEWMIFIMENISLACPNQISRE